MKNSLDAHWRAWVDQPIPARHNQTPRQAIKKPEDKKRLDALLLQYEHHHLD